MVSQWEVRLQLRLIRAHHLTAREYSYDLRDAFARPYTPPRRSSHECELLYPASLFPQLIHFVQVLSVFKIAILLFIVVTGSSSATSFCNAL